MHVSQALAKSQLHRAAFEQKARELYVENLSLKTAQKKTHSRDSGPPPAALSNFVSKVTKAGQKLTVLFDLWPSCEAFKASERLNIDLWSMRRYMNTHEEWKASQAEVFDCMPDLEDEKYEALAEAMGSVSWICTEVSTTSSSSVVCS